MFHGTVNGGQGRKRANLRTGEPDIRTKYHIWYICTPGGNPEMDVIEASYELMLLFWKWVDWLGESPWRMLWTAVGTVIFIILFAAGSAASEL